KRGIFGLQDRGDAIAIGKTEGKQNIGDGAIEPLDGNRPAFHLALDTAPLRDLRIGQGRKARRPPVDQPAAHMGHKTHRAIAHAWALPQNIDMSIAAFGDLQKCGPYFMRKAGRSQKDEKDKSERESARHGLAASTETLYFRLNAAKLRSFCVC